MSAQMLPPLGATPPRWFTQSELGEIQQLYEVGYGKTYKFIPDLIEQVRWAHLLKSELIEALSISLELLRSAHHVSNAYLVADRGAAETNWRALRDRLREGIECASAAIKKARGAP